MADILKINLSKEETEMLLTNHYVMAGEDRKYLILEINRETYNFMVYESKNKGIDYSYRLSESTEITLTY